MQNEKDYKSTPAHAHIFNYWKDKYITPRGDGYETFGSETEHLL